MITNNILCQIEAIEGSHLRKKGEKPKLLICIGELIYARLRLENSYETDRVRFDAFNKKIANYDFFIGGEKETCKIIIIEEITDVDMGV